MKNFIGKYGWYLAAAFFTLLVIASVFWGVKKVIEGGFSGKGNTVNFLSGGDDFTVDAVRKITIKKDGDSGRCIEITRDGAVRVYETCGGELSEAFRSNDSRAVHRLFRDISRTRMSREYVPGSLEVEVETDQGTFVYYLMPGDGANDDSPGISGLIETIINDNPNLPPTSTPIPPGAPTLTPAPFVTPTVKPSPTLVPGAPTPTPLAVGEFTCDFSQTATGKRPYRVSNFVCSSEPVPAQ